MIPDFEAIITAHLDGPLAEIGATVRGKTPSTLLDPWVRLTLLDAPEVDNVDHLIAAYVQLDCYAGTDGGQAEASLVARTARAALKTLPDVTHAGAVITGCRIDGMPRIPDTTLEPARERFILTATVWGHS